MLDLDLASTPLEPDELEAELLLLALEQDLRTTADALAPCPPVAVRRVRTRPTASHGERVPDLTRRPAATVVDIDVRATQRSPPEHGLAGPQRSAVT